MPTDRPLTGLVETMFHVAVSENRGPPYRSPNSIIRTPESYPFFATPTYILDSETSLFGVLGWRRGLVGLEVSGLGFRV